MDNKNKNQEQQISINFDTNNILYTDNIYITTNPDGVIMDVMQRFLSTNQIRVVSRIGMSREHAKKFVAELGKLLAITEGQSVTGEKKN